MNRNSIYIIIGLIFSFSLVFSQINYRAGSANSATILTGEDYVTGEDGIPRMNVNIWGHVKYPGNYLVYDGIDILTCLSMAGGPMKGAKLSKVSIVSNDGTSREIDLNKIMKNNDIYAITLKPYDTIYIDQSLGNFLLTKTSVVAVLLQLTNVILEATNNQ